MSATLLRGSLYIGFPKTLVISEMERLTQEISDYIDNNELSLEVLKSDNDYKELSFLLCAPYGAYKEKYHYQVIKIEDELKSPIYIQNHKIEDVSELLRRNGYIYDPEEDTWIEGVEL